LVLNTVESVFGSGLTTHSFPVWAKAGVSESNDRMMRMATMPHPLVGMFGFIVILGSMFESGLIVV